MPGFQNPLSISKRKHPYDETNLPQKKRAAISRESQNGTSNSRRADAYWMVQWYVELLTDFNSKLNQTIRRNPQYKKHKTWDGDAFVVLTGHKMMLVSERGVM